MIRGFSKRSIEFSMPGTDHSMYTAKPNNHVKPQCLEFVLCVIITCLFLMPLHCIKINSVIQCPILQPIHSQCPWAE